MNKPRRLVSVLALLAAFMLLFSVLYIALEADHDCCGEDCAICAQLRACEDLLRDLGLTVEPFSQAEVAVRSVPLTLGQNETADFLREAIAELENGRIPGAEKKRAAILQQACKHAVKGGERLPDKGMPIHNCLTELPKYET